MERMITEYRYGHGVIEHLHRYSFSMPFVREKVVLDLASGEGYGSFLMAQKAKYVYGVDVSDHAVIRANEKYKKGNLIYKVGSAIAIPLADRCVDVVVSFETIEHLLEQEEMITEISRVLKREGVLIISTPERENYRPTDPNNPYHVKELNAFEFETLVKLRFRNVKMLRQRYVSASIIYTDEMDKSQLTEVAGNFDKLTEQESFLGKHLFNVAIASNAPLHDAMYFQIFNGNEVITLQSQYMEGILNEILSSRTYRIGQLILWPLSQVKKYLRQWK